MTIAALRLPEEMLNSLKMRAIKISLARKKPFTWAELAREMFERELSKPEPSFSVQMDSVQ